MTNPSYRWMLWISFFVAAAFLTWRLWPDARHHDWTGVVLTLLFWGGGVIVALYHAIRGRGPRGA